MVGSKSEKKLFRSGGAFLVRGGFTKEEFKSFYFFPRRVYPPVVSHSLKTYQRDLESAESVNSVLVKLYWFCI